MSYSVTFNSNAKFGDIGGKSYCLWHYQIELDDSATGHVGLGFSSNLDIKDPSLYVQVAELQGSELVTSTKGFQFVSVAALQANNGILDVYFIAPCASDPFTPITLVSMDSVLGTPQVLPFQTPPADTDNATQVITGPAVGPTPNKQLGTLPYASELYGVYQPLIGWRSALSQERVSNATTNRFVLAASLVGDFADFSPDNTFPTIATTNATDRTGSSVGQQLAANMGVNSQNWSTVLSGSAGSPLYSITQNVISGLQNNPASVTYKPQLNREAATATLFQYAAQNAPSVVANMFQPKLALWQRAIAGAQWFSENLPPNAAFLSPIGILHLFREYFFEIGTFIGPPVGHVWISPGGTVEVIEVNTRRTLVDLTVEQSTQTVQKSELNQTNQDELSDAVKTENADDTKLGVTASASGGVAPVFQASGTASFNLDSSRKQAQEQTHKRMREQSSKLSSEVTQNYKTTFRTVTETTDTSSRRYTIQNTTDRLVSYELSRKMRKVAVQVQDLGQQLCWQLYIDNPGDTLALGEFVHATSAALDPGIKQPDMQPPPANSQKPMSLAIPFVLFQGADSGATDTYQTEPGRPDHGLFSPDVGSDDIIQFDHSFKLGPPPTGFVLDSFGGIDFHGAEVQWSTDLANTKVDPTTNTFSIRLTHANFGGRPALPFDVSLNYVPTAEAIAAIDTANKAAKTVYDDQVALKKEQLFYDTLRTRLKLIGQVKLRPQDDLREEERNVIYRSIIARLYGSEIGWLNDDYHLASELIRYFFDVDSMLYFVAPDWWRPRQQTLVSKNDQGELQPTVVAEPAISARVINIGRTSIQLWPGKRGYYLITEETAPAPQGASLGWLMQLDGDVHRNAFLNSPWVKAVLPIRQGRERDAIAFLRRPEVAGADGLTEPYPFDPGLDPPEYNGLTIEDVLLMIADKIAQEYADSFTPVPVDSTGVNPQLALPTEIVFSHGFDPLEGGIKFGPEPFKVFSQWIEVLPTDQIVATEYTLTGL